MAGNTTKPSPTSSSNNTTTTEGSLLAPNPTPTATSRRGSIPKSTPAWDASSANGGSGAAYPDDPTSSLRKEMNLVAEAAKRASVAIVVRDLQDFTV